MDLTNYETFLIDYLDGKLSAAEVEEVLLFLENHPEIKEEFEGLNEISFQTETMSIDPSFLYKPQFAVVQHQYEPLLVAQLEGDISTSDQLLLEQGFMLYPELNTEKQLFAQTKFIPELSLVFPNKQHLQKGTVFVLHRQRILRVAAVLLATCLLGLFWSQLNKNTPPPVAQKTAPKSISKPENKQYNPANSSIQYSQKEESQNVQPAKIQPLIQTNQPATIALIAPKQHTRITNPTLTETASLPTSKLWLKHKTPVEPADEHFVSIPDFLRNKLASETKQLEQKTKTTLQEMNKTAGISIQKDSSGRITHFEIEALGFAWSQTK